MQKPTMNMWSIKRSIAKRVFASGAKQSLVGVCFVVLLLAMTIPLPVRAADFVFDSFVSTMSVRADGTLDVQEIITVTFTSARRGIYRVIPTHYVEEDGQEQILQVSNIGVTDEAGQSLTTSISNDEALSIRIGDANRTVIGEQTYVIHYTVEGALAAFDDFDELYWNVTGSEWDTPPERVITTINFSDDFLEADLRLSCYTGVYQSTEKDCQIAFVGQTVTATVANNFLTVAVGWPKGLVEIPAPVYATALTDITEHPASYAIWLLPFAAFVLMFLRWHKHGRDPKGRGTVVPEYGPPKGLRAAEMGMVWANKVNDAYLSAAMVELAVLGHIKIIEQVEERLGPDRKTFTLERTDKPTDGLRPWEIALLSALFRRGAATVSEDQLKKHFAKDKKPAVSVLETRMVDEGYFAAHPGRARGGWTTLSVILLFIGFQIVSIPLMLTGGIVLLFGWLMAKRTPKGAEALDQAKGFKLFLSTAEKYRLEWQEKEGIFEKYLPYAMVFGVADKWAKAFAALHIEPSVPAWYVGAALLHFNAVDFTSRMNNLSHQMASVAAPKSSGSGGGGFSGGGFGGGGGGSW